MSISTTLTEGIPAPAALDRTVPLILPEPDTELSVTVNDGWICVLAPPLPVIVIVGLYFPTGRLLFGLIVKYLDWPGARVVSQFKPFISVQFATVGKAFSVTLLVPVFVIVIICADCAALLASWLPKLKVDGEADIVDDVFELLKFSVTNATLLV
jgi:hypothetical protein